MFRAAHRGLKSKGRCRELPFRLELIESILKQEKTVFGVPYESKDSGTIALATFFDVYEGMC